VAIQTYDPFDLPDWLGTERVTWRTEGSFADDPRVAGWLCAEGRSQPLDLLAVDAAYPEAVCPPEQRHDAHQSWHFGQVLLLGIDARVAAAVPGVRFDANLVIESIRRVAKALGAPGANFTVMLTL
jgi:hypothetical protein